MLNPEPYEKLSTSLCSHHEPRREALPEPDLGVASDVGERAEAAEKALLEGDVGCEP